MLRVPYRGFHTLVTHHTGTGWLQTDGPTETFATLTIAEIMAAMMMMILQLVMSYDGVHHGRQWRHL